MSSHKERPLEPGQVFFADAALEIQMLRNHAYLITGVSDFQRGTASDPEARVRDALKDLLNAPKA